MSVNLTVRCSSLNGALMPELERDWKDLESRSEPTVFLSWQWIGVWLDVYEPAGRLLRVYRDDRLIGACIVVEATEKRHGLLRSRSLRLHQTGQPFEDQIWIEYNGVLCERGSERDVTRASLEYLCREDDQWEELVIGAIDAREADHYANATGLSKHVRWEAPCYGVDLSRLDLDSQHYLSTLTANTRYQIRRSMRMYHGRGGLRISRPQSVDEALAVFEAIGPRHLARWGGGMNESGFANPEFVRFHRTMIQRHWPEGRVDLVSIWAGTELIGTFYNLLYDNVVYFYLSGLKVESDNKLKPGLIGHALCIENYRSQGFQFYDFMGGAERYKAQLGARHRYLVQIALQRNRLKFRLEHAARQAKRRWVRVT